MRLSALCTPAAVNFAATPRHTRRARLLHHHGYTCLPRPRAATQRNSSMTTGENTEDGGREAPPWKKLGAGLITGAADDDPSGIATDSQVGAAFGYGMLWCAFLSMPLMIASQAISAGIGRVTGHGLMGGLRLHYPRT